ncbi:hypothetical protein Ddye_021272 [Dipteronia dyeriana]|uniref:Uncharacterized protein n=1 Tax=Dipteronia dyeriana TaxID=168575 RepID=A0AAD9U1X6_9ROSI|nr:hypothetical protein Ddye_021272 [Dipteronia dyeriana]
MFATISDIVHAPDEDEVPQLQSIKDQQPSSSTQRASKWNLLLLRSFPWYLRQIDISTKKGLWSDLQKSRCLRETEQLTPPEAPQSSIQPFLNQLIIIAFVRQGKVRSQESQIF